MFRSKSSLVFLLTSLLLYSSFSDAEIILKPVGPTTFATVTGTVGLTSETITEGTISAFVQGMTTSTEVDSNGGFTLTVATDSLYSLYATLALTGVPNVNMNFINLTAISEGDTRQVDLTRASGRLLGRVNVIGGTLGDLSLSASSSVTNGAVFESFSSYGSAIPINNQVPEVLLAMPSGITTEVSGNVQITTDLGCELQETLASQSINVLESSNTNPLIVEWTVDVSNVICNPASLIGTFQIDGLNTSAVLGNHQLGLDGPVYREVNLTEFGPFQFDQLIEGNYLVLQKSSFAEPFGELTYPDANIDVTGNATYDAIHAVGMARGQVTLSGEWNYTNVNTANISLSGSNAITAPNFMSASDDIDFLTGNYDLVLGVGNWDLQNYFFDFEQEISGVRKYQFVNVSMLPEQEVTRFSITEGQSLNLPEAAFETFTAELDLVVEQQPGQSEVTIEQLTITGYAQLFDPPGDELRGATTLYVARSGSQDNRFLITVYGLPGTYQMTARGTGSDDRIYSASFELILGGDSPDTPDPLGCFGINNMKVHLADGKSHDKLHIQKASFRLPEDAAVDLDQDSVSIAVDGISYDLPAGSFKQEGYKRSFVYKSTHGEIPHIHARLNFDKAEWKLKVKESDITLIDNTDGVDVTLTIGDYVGSENIIMHSKDHHGTKLKYKRKPKLSCRLEKMEKSKDDDRDDDRDDDKYNDEDQ